MIRKVVSGGQTGVDRAGFDTALSFGIPIGGYCAKGRGAEDGTIPEQYPMTELESAESFYRTERNVMESDGTLIINLGELTQGTMLTYDFTLQYGKPSLIVQLDAEELIKPEHVVRWIKAQYIRVLNIAGPRESKIPGGIYNQACDYLSKVFDCLREEA